MLVAEPISQLVPRNMQHVSIALYFNYNSGHHLDRNKS